MYIYITVDLCISSPLGLFVTPLFERFLINFQIKMVEQLMQTRRPYFWIFCSLYNYSEENLKKKIGYAISLE